MSELLGLAASSSQIPLPIIHEQLKGLLSKAHENMVDLINEDYADFISLSTRLVGLDDRIEALKPPLNAFESRITRAEDDYRKRYQEIQNLLRKRSEARTEQSNSVTLETMKQSLERILSIQAQADISQKELERIATEFSHWNYWISEHSSWNYVQENKPQILRLEDQMLTTLQNILTGHFSDGLEDIDAYIGCLKLYGTLGRFDLAENIFYDAVVKDELERVLNEYSEKRVNEGNISNLYQSITDLIDKKFISFARKTRIDGFETKFQFYVNSIAQKIFDKIMLKFPSIFSAANPQTFRSMFEKSLSFVQELENRCENVDEFRKMRACKAYQDFAIHKWPLTVYYQIRFKDIASKMDSSLDSCLVNNDSENIQVPCFPATTGLIKALEHTWSDSVYIDQLKARFWRLSLQIIHRYSSWVKTSVEELTSENSNNMSSSESLNSAQVSSSRVNQVNPDLIALKILSDIEFARRHILDFFDSKVSQKLGPNSDQARLTLSSLFNELECAHKDELFDFFIENILAQCTDSLKLLKNIPAQYRRTNRPAPTKASFFVPQILKPLQIFENETKRIYGKNPDFSFSSFDQQVTKIIEEISKR